MFTLIITIAITISKAPYILATQPKRLRSHNLNFNQISRKLMMLKSVSVVFFLGLGPGLGLKGQVLGPGLDLDVQVLVNIHGLY